MATTVSDYFVERLYKRGVRRIYGYPGDGINGVFGWPRACGQGKAELYNRWPGRNLYLLRTREFFMLKFLASTAGIIFLVGLVVIIGLLMLIF